MLLAAKGLLLHSKVMLLTLKSNAFEKKKTIVLKTAQNLLILS